MIKAFATAFAALLLSMVPAHADTFTVEPWDFDGIWGISWVNLTQLNFNGSQCPCQKVLYPATGLPWDNQTGANQIWALVQAGTIKPGDTIMGFSLGSQVVSLFMSQHPLPAGIKVLLAGDTFFRNNQFGAQGIPLNTATKVTLVANEYDGWSDIPDRTTAPGYSMAMNNSSMGSQQVHNYVHAQLGNPANVVEVRGNITAILIPNQKLPMGDETKRAEIDDAYSRKAPTADQLAAATDEQVNGTPAQTPEPTAH
jgi:hypothetical protein